MYLFIDKIKNSQKNVSIAFLRVNTYKYGQKNAKKGQPLSFSQVIYTI